MKLTQRSNGIWQLDLRAEGGGRISTGTRDKSEALIKAKRILSGQVEEERNFYSMGEALDDTWDSVWRHQKGHKEQHYVVEIVRRKFGEVPVAAMTYALVNEWVQQCRKAGRAASTINSYVSCISRALRMAGDLGKIEMVPRMPRLRVRNQKIRYLTPAEEAALHESARACLDDTEAVVMVNLMVTLVQTGCRLSEIVKLEPDDVGRRAIVLADTKNTRPRSVPLTTLGRDALETLMGLEAWQRVQELGQRKAKDWCVRRFTRCRNHAKLPDVTLHILRHTTASRLVQAGVDLYKVKTILGHSSHAVTERYAHLDVSHLEGDMAVLDTTPQSDNVVSIRRHRR